MNNRTVSAAFRYALLALASLIIAAPLVWAVSASLRPANESFASGNVFFGTGATLENFRIVLTLAPFARYYVNSLAQVSLIIVFQVVFSSLAAYAFARWNFRGKNLLFGIILTQMMIPFAALLRYALFRIRVRDLFAPAEFSFHPGRFCGRGGNRRLQLGAGSRPGLCSERGGLDRFLRSFERFVALERFSVAAHRHPVRKCPSHIDGTSPIHTDGRNRCAVESARRRDAARGGAPHSVVRCLSRTFFRELSCGRYQMRNVELIIRDPAHLEAHRTEFLIPLEEVLSAVNEVLNTRPASPGKEDIFVVRTSRPVGRGGLARVFPWTANDYWAPRAGRSIPSHLIYARRRPVRTLCVWGTWNTDSVFA